MKINDFIFEFKSKSKVINLYRVRTFMNSQVEKYVIITYVDSKYSTSSVTNEIEYIRESLLNEGFICDNTIVIEHYDYKNSYDIVTFDDKGLSPSWMDIKIDDLKQLLEVSSIELSGKTLNSDRLFKLLENKQFRINPLANVKSLSDWDYLERQSEIDDNKINLEDLKFLVKKNATEREIQDLLKKDLSILGEIYSGYDDEYICFSEFPVGEGFVDFVVFSGRSWMNITFIEIKGANYNLLIKNSYKTFSSKTNEAIQQISKRIGYVKRNPNDFKNFVHKIRKEVESGEKKFNSFLGPRKRLYVDKNKDINLFTVVIGGRGENDLEESYSRHYFADEQKNPMKIESWDSFLEKIRIS